MKMFLPSAGGALGNEETRFWWNFRCVLGLVAGLPARFGQYEKLTRRHAVKLVPAVSCSVEEVSLAGGEVVGYGSVKSASRMNGAVVIFLDSPEKVSDVVVSGVVIQDSFTPVHPLVNPARKITISNVPPFIRNGVLAKELSRFGQLVSPIKMLSLGSKSPLLRTRRLHGFRHITSETMKCFGCGAQGHLIRSCPEGAGGRRAAAAAGEGVRGPGARRGRPLRDRPLAAVSPSACSGGEVSNLSKKMLKASKMIKGSKAGKSPAESESESLLTQEEQTLYSPADIKKFLQGTKGTRQLKVEDHFSDLKLFIESARPLVRPQVILSHRRPAGGIRQGCCLSGMLYSLAIEPLLHKLRNKLSGVCVPGCDVSFKLSAYADDVVALVNSQKDIDILTNTVDQIWCISSARVNWGKSEAVVVGDRLGGQLRLPGGLMWKKGGLKYLGVFLGNEMFVEKNWENVLEKVKGRLEKWKWLVPKMSYRGRVLILNNLISTALWHRLACVNPPVSLLSRIQAVLGRLFLGQVALGPSEHPVSAKGGGWTGSGPSSQQGRCLPPSVLTETPHRTCRPGLEAFILPHPAEVWWSETGSGSVPDGLQESGHFISASFLQKCFLSVDFTEEAEEGTGRLSVLGPTGTGTVQDSRFKIQEFIVITQQFTSAIIGMKLSLSLVVQLECCRNRRPDGSRQNSL
ncbi:hypothetical protein L3Q82_012163 [Scortum barcoo]|uniref:Uncharacterized protein n=1 Tax=Scortum barcoo TaxID=214431 RepID=A0ACB8W709_9TELE|nr:hypothetical protein L3Q82_012163 [Scortum barcoo]